MFRLAETDEEGKDAYTKIAAANIKKRSPTKKEKDTAWKSIKDREAIIKQLESVWREYNGLASQKDVEKSLKQEYITRTYKKKVRLLELWTY